MKRFFKLVLLIAALVTIVFLFLESWRESLYLDWRAEQPRPEAVQSEVLSDLKETGSDQNSVQKPKIEVSEAASKGQALFSAKCVACHSIGKGDGVGPDLAGITERRQEDWLKKFIQYPSRMFAEKDPIATQLLEKYKTPMVDMGISDEEVAQILEYLKNADGMSADPSTSEEEKRMATKADILRGLALFQGKERFSRGGTSCFSCHSVRGGSLFGGGTLAKELTTSYERLGEVGIAALLKNPPFPVMKEAYIDKDLTEDEIFQVSAYLEDVGKAQVAENPKRGTSKLLLLMVLGTALIALLLICFVK